MSDSERVVRTRAAIAFWEPCAKTGLTRAERILAEMALNIAELTDAVVAFTKHR